MKFCRVKIDFLCMLVLILTFCVTGCKKIVNVKYKEVNVTIEKADYDPPRVTYIHSGKTNIPISRSASYEVIVSYNGKQYCIDNSATYKKYKDKVGETVTGTLEETWLEDGTVRYDITKLK